MAVAAEIGASRDPQTVVAVFAADHVVLDQKGFLAVCSTAAEAAAAEGRDRDARHNPDRAGDRLRLHPSRQIRSASATRAASPPSSRSRTHETAKHYVAEGYLWNSGNFFFRADAMLSEMRAFEPDMAEAAPRRSPRRSEDLGFLVLDKEAFERAEDSRSTTR